MATGAEKISIAFAKVRGKTIDGLFVVRCFRETEEL